MAAEDDNESLRLSDDERLHALNALGEHYAAGRINMSEFEDLSGRAADARRLGELDGLFTGLPGGVPLAVSGGALVKRDIAVPASPEEPAPEGKATPGKNLELASDEAELESLRKRGELVESLDWIIIGVTLVAFLILQLALDWSYAWVVWPSLIVTLSVPRVILRYSDEDELIYDEFKHDEVFSDEKVESRKARLRKAADRINELENKRDTE